MDAKRQLNENHALRRLYNSHPLAANRSLITIKQHGSHKSTGHPFQKQPKPTKTDFGNNKFSSLPDKCAQGLANELLKVESIDLQDELRIPDGKLKEQRNNKIPVNASERNTHNKAIINGLRSGVSSAPLLDTSDCFTSRSELLRRKTPDGLGSISVSRLQINEKSESPKLAARNSQRRCNTRSSGSALVKNGTFDQTFLPEININRTSGSNNNNTNNTDKIVKNEREAGKIDANEVLMFGRWGYRPRKDTRRKIPKCWTDNHGRNLSINTTNCMELSANKTQASQKLTYFKRVEQIDQVQYEDNGLKVPLAPSTSPTLIDEPSSVASHTSESHKINLKLDVIINSQQKENKNDDNDVIKKLSETSFERSIGLQKLQQSSIEEEDGQDGGEDSENEDGQQQQSDHYEFEETDEMSKL